MLLIALLLCALLATAVMIGTRLLNLAGGLEVWTSGERALIAAWFGLAVIGNSLLATALFTPLTPVASLAVVTFLTGTCFLVRRRFPIRVTYVPRAWRPMLLLIIAAVAVMAARPVTHYDSGLYHAGFVRWAAEQGVPPGLGLLHARFGFVSSWLALPAALNHGVLAQRVLTVGGAVAMFLLLALITLAGRRALRGRASAADIFALVAGLLILPVAARLAATGSPDLPLMVLILMTAWTMILADHRDAPSPARVVPLALAVAAVTIKLSALPLLLVASVFAAWSMRRARDVMRIVVVSVIVLAPITATGFTISGCPAFPIPAFCLDTETSLGAGSANQEARIIRDWARWDGSTPTYAGGTNWLPPWLLRHPYTAVLLFTSVVLALTAAFNRKANLQLGVLWLAVVGAAFALIAAPSPRFVIPYATLVPALWLSTRATSGTHARRGGFAIGMAVVAFTVGANVYAAIRHAPHRLDSGLLLAPARLPDPPVRMTDAVNFRYAVPSGGDDRCWVATLPCAPFELERKIRLRDSRHGLGGGFAREDSR